MNDDANYARDSIFWEYHEDNERNFSLIYGKAMDRLWNWRRSHWSMNQLNPDLTSSTVKNVLPTRSSIIKTGVLNILSPLCHLVTIIRCSRASANGDRCCAIGDYCRAVTTIRIALKAGFGQAPRLKLSDDCVNVSGIRAASGGLTGDVTNRNIIHISICVVRDMDMQRAS